jgi:hypothetical protein
MNNTGANIQFYGLFFQFSYLLDASGVLLNKKKGLNAQTLKIGNWYLVISNCYLLIVLSPRQVANPQFDKLSANLSASSQCVFYLLEFLF